MKKSAGIFIIGIIIFCLAGCGKDQDGSSAKETDIDYNEYMVYKSTTALTPSGYYFVGDNYLSYMTDDSPYTILCSKPECRHNSQECEGRFMGKGIGYADNHLYYVDDLEAETYGLYQMSLTGRERKLVRKLDMIQDVTLGYSVRICGKYLALNTGGMAYLIPLEKEKEAELVFQPDDNALSYDTYKLTNDWMVVAAATGDRAWNLVGYNLHSKKKVVLYENWIEELYDFYITDENEMYYFVGKDGFYKKNLETGKAVKFRDAEPGIEDGAACYDDKYAYIRTIPAFTGKGRGIRVYDREGKQLEYISTENMKESLSYAFSTEKRVYFFDFMNLLPPGPRYYIEKDKIGTGKAKLVKVKYE